MYLIMIKNDYDDNYRKLDADTIEDVEGLIRENWSEVDRVLIAQPVEFDARITVRIKDQTRAPKPPAEPPAAPKTPDQEVLVEAPKSKTKSN